MLIGETVHAFVGLDRWAPAARFHSPAADIMAADLLKKGRLTRMK
jgi:hypothetical protein